MLTLGRFLLAIQVGAVLVACGSVDRKREFEARYDEGGRPLAGCVSCRDNACGKKLLVQYLGSAGILLEHGTTRLLFSPFVSNPGVLDVLFLGVETDHEFIEQWVDRYALRNRLADVQAILVGHGHYDHLLDVPKFAEL